MKARKRIIRIYKLVNLFLIPTSIVFISNQQKKYKLVYNKKSNKIIFKRWTKDR